MKAHNLLGMGDKFSSAVAPLAMLILSMGPWDEAFRFDT
jgi:hypothetical protein